LACLDGSVTALESESREALREIVERGSDLPLDRVLLLIAKEEYPGVEIEAYLGALDRLALRAQSLMHQYDGLAGAIRQAIFIEGGFRGNGENYYDPKNSMLNEVIDRRLGIPITLSIIYMEVARRLGSRALGVGLPGHFLVRHELGEDCSILIDPFDQGAIIRRSDCERLLKRVNGPSAELEAWMLAPASPTSIVVRVLTNLKHAYMLQRDYVNAVRAIDRLLIFDRDRWADRRDRGLLFVELGCVGAAVTDLEAYLENGGRGPEADLIRRVLPELRKKVSLLN
jgi:regulator of sirC expression with transglutaminase-like and TPR domain